MSDDEPWHWAYSPERGYYRKAGSSFAYTQGNLLLLNERKLERLRVLLKARIEEAFLTPLHPDFEEMLQNDSLGG